MADSSLQLVSYGGTLAVTGAALSAAHKLHAPQLSPPSFPLHLTLLTKAEYRSLGQSRPPLIDTSHLHVLGLGGLPSRGLYWLVVVWNHGNRWRKSVGLPAKQFHVTLSEKDDHALDKGTMSLVGGDEAVRRMFEGLSEDGMDQVLASPETRMVHETPYYNFLCRF